MTVDGRELIRREPHTLPAGWSWTWQDDVFSFAGGAQPPSFEFVHEPRPGYVRLVQIRDYYTDTHKTYVPDTSKLRKCGARDVMIARYGSAGGSSTDSLGRICRGIPGAYNVALAKATPCAGIDNNFLFYLLQSHYFQDQLRGLSARSVQSGFNRAGLRTVLLPVPPMPEQRAVAGVLGALDDKIDANTRIVKLGLEFADAWYADWRSGLAGLRQGTFADIADVHGGSTPKTGVPDYWCGEYAWAVPRDITALGAPYLFDTERHISDSGLASIGNRLHPPGSIFMTSRATIGAFAVVQRPCAANQGFIVVVPVEPVSRWFLFHEMRSRVGEMLDLANGSTFLELSRGNFKRIPVPLPGIEQLKALNATLSQVHASCAATVAESTSLARLRDVLLPALLSGVLRVRDAEALVGEAV